MKNRSHSKCQALLIGLLIPSAVAGLMLLVVAFLLGNLP
jgi:hypothetical protein